MHSVYCRYFSYLLGFFCFQISLAVSILGFYVNLFQLFSFIASFALLKILDKVLAKLIIVVVVLTFQILSFFLFADANFDNFSFLTRTLSYFFFLLPLFSFPFIFKYEVLSVFDVVKGLIHSGYSMIIIGYIQLMGFIFLGFDLFPYDYFYGGDGRSAIVLFKGEEVFRLTALSGEPKTYGMFLVLFLSFYLSYVWRERRKIVGFVVVGSLLLLIALTASTSAYLLLLLLCVAVIFNVRVKGVVYGGVLFAVFALGVTLAVIFSDVGVTVSSYDHVKIGENFLYDRIVARLNGLEDYDYLSVAALSDHFYWVIFGGVWPYLNGLLPNSIALPYWMESDTIFVPKMGILTLLSILGVPLLCFFIFHYYKIVFNYINYYTRMQIVLIAVFLPSAVLLRSYLLVFTVMLVSIIFSNSFRNAYFKAV
ncbi:hypothetical protein [Limnobacter sp.]|uniref:hypothetical protein n=1 Tax=Limnobacter sp. TaxID=2003368 RepID=UPI003BABFE3B